MNYRDKVLKVGTFFSGIGSPEKALQKLKEENIIDSEICSVCNKDIIHSYRAHGKNAGRATQIIMLL